MPQTTEKLSKIEKLLEERDRKFGLPSFDTTTKRSTSIFEKRLQDGSTTPDPEPVEGKKRSSVTVAAILILCALMTWGLAATLSLVR